MVLGSIPSGPTFFYPVKNNLDKSDWPFIGLLIFLTAVYSLAFRFTIPPFEDAAMLMRYARHVADGHGIVWNIGEKPIDGATDFLFMMLLSLMVNLGLSLEFAVRSIGIVSHALTILIIYIGIRKFYNANRWFAFVPAFYFLIGPGFGYAEAGFGASFFALVVCLAWSMAIKISEGGDSHIASLLFSLLTLAVGLIRPEGVFLSLLILLSIIYAKGLRHSLRPIVYFTLTFALFGSAYFFWRWNYFGDPLPNPFYVKGGGHFHFTGLISSIAHTLMLLGPFCIAYILALRSENVFRKAMFSLIPITGFVLIWTLMKNEMNYLMRYQYPVLAMALISFVPLVQTIPEEWSLPSFAYLNKRSRFVLLVAAVFVAASFVFYQHKKYSSSRYLEDGLYDAAIMLKKYSDKNYTMVSSEAGVLPLYSCWKAVDPYGLNDQWIAHHGGITEEYLDKFKPQLIVFRALFSPLGMQAPIEKTKQWYDMTMILKYYAEKNNYILAASFGDTPYDTHNYYVRSDFPESKEIVTSIRNIPYKWDTGKPAVNFALLKTLGD